MTFELRLALPEHVSVPAAASSAGGWPLTDLGWQADGLSDDDSEERAGKATHPTLFLLKCPMVGGRRTDHAHHGQLRGWTLRKAFVTFDFDFRLSIFELRFASPELVPTNLCNYPWCPWPIRRPPATGRLQYVNSTWCAILPACSSLSPSAGRCNLYIMFSIRLWMMSVSDTSKRISEVMYAFFLFSLY